MTARVSLEQSLERCLEELTRTGDVEASLRRYPQYADRLRPLLEMAQVTRRCYDAVPKAPGGLAAGRERLLAVAAQRRAPVVPSTSVTRVTTTRPGGRKLKLALAMKLIAVLLAAIVGTAVLGGGVIWAANKSQPGDLLYRVKLAREDVRLALASAPEDQVDLALQFTEERSDEIQALVADGRQVPDESVARMERHIEYVLTQVACASDEEMAGLLTCIAERTHTQAQMLEQMQATAPRQAQAGLERAVTVCRQGAEAAEDGLSDPQTFRWRYCHQQKTPEPAKEPEQVTATPDQEQDQERHQRHDQERDYIPVGTPHHTPRGPQATSVPQATPQGPQATSAPQATPQGPQATSAPQTTPQGPQATPVPPATTPQPQQPGDGQGEDGQDDDEHGGGEHSGGGQDDGAHGGGGHDGGGN